MRPFVALALFCDSVRPEKSGTDSIIGVLPDNMNISDIPGAVPRLSIYVRLQIDPSVDPNPVRIVLKTPDNKERELMVISSDTVDKARAEAVDGKPFGGVIARMELSPFPVQEYGRIFVIVRTAFEEVTAGTLNFRRKPASSPAEPSPPAPQPRAARKPRAKKRAAARS